MQNSNFIRNSLDKLIKATKPISTIHQINQKYKYKKQLESKKGLYLKSPSGFCLNLCAGGPSEEEGEPRCPRFIENY